PDRHPPTPTLFPYTTLFRSSPRLRQHCRRGNKQEGKHAGQTGTRMIFHRVKCGRISILGTVQPNNENHYFRLRFCMPDATAARRDRKSTRLNSSHVAISYAV